MKRAGFSLMEVILALTILAGAIAVLGEASRQSLRNAEAARDLARAQLLCESKLTEIACGLTPAQSVDNTPFDPAMTASIDPSEPAWLYSIEANPAEEEGLLSVRVTVTRDLPAARHPVAVSIVRWLPDPNATPAGQNDTGSSSTSGSENNANTL